MRSLQVLTVVLLASSMALSANHARAAVRSKTKQFAEPKPDAALVYFIRENRFSGNMQTAFVYADETFVATVDNDSYTFAYLPPGKRLLWLNWQKINLEVDLEAGKTYYYVVWTSFEALDHASGQAFVEAVASHVTPDSREIDKSADHIRDRYAKVVAAAVATPDDATRATSLARRAAHVAKWPKVDLARHSVLCVEPLEMADPRAANRSQEYLVTTAPTRIASLILEELGSSAFSEVRQQGSCAGVPGAVALHGRITQYKPGSEIARFMIAGAGNAQIELVVTLADATSGEPLVELEAKGTWAWGGGMGAGRRVTDLDKNVAYEVASYLKQARGVPLPEEP